MKKSRKKLKLLHSLSPLAYVLVFGLVIIVAFYLGAQFSKQSSTSSIKEAPNKQDRGAINNRIAEGLLTPNPSITPPDFSNETIKPRNSFDVSRWELYVNDEVGLRFRYPPEWGKPNGGLNSCDNPEICSDNDLPAKTFLLKFPNSKFQIGGGSKNYTPHRGTNILYDYTGFTKWYSPERICKTPWFIFCQQAENKINYVSVPACGGEPGSGFGYERVLLVNLPNNKVNGLAFGGDFIPKNLMTGPLASCDNQTKSRIGEAVIARKLNEEIMKSFDTFEKVFETIEIR